MREPMPRSVHSLVASSLDSADDAEFERLLVAGHIVYRNGEHYRIDGAVESLEELERQAGRRCECGTPVSVRNGARICRRCHREFRSEPCTAAGGRGLRPTLGSASLRALARLRLGKSV